jgi:hypothetical protein
VYTPPDTFWGNYNEISQYNQKLNTFELLWAAWYAYLQNDVLATGIISFVMHELVYFGRSLPWFIISYIPYFDKYKIQGVCLPPNLSIKEVLTLVGENSDSARTMAMRTNGPFDSLHC